MPQLPRPFERSHNSPLAGLQGTAKTFLLPDMPSVEPRPIVMLPSSSRLPSVRCLYSEYQHFLSSQLVRVTDPGARNVSHWKTKAPKKAPMKIMMMM